MNAHRKHQYYFNNFFSSRPLDFQDSIPNSDFKKRNNSLETCFIGQLKNFWRNVVPATVLMIIFLLTMVSFVKFIFMVPSLSVFTYIYSHLIEKDSCDCRKISVKLSCVYVCISSRDLFIFSIRVSSFFSYSYLHFLWFTWLHFTTLQIAAFDLQELV